MIPGAECVCGLPEPRPGHPVRPISISEVELSAPGPTEILVGLEAAGICHSDLSVVRQVIMFDAADAAEGQGPPCSPAGNRPSMICLRLPRM
jgi:NADPH:quinone reductase-like Zn-dependent oxidoreductase